MKNYTRILSILTLALLTIALPASAQTNDNKNKAIVETTEGTQQLNTDDISVIRFDGDKVTFVQPWGNTTFDRTLRSLSFLRPLPGTLRLTATTDISANNGGNRAQSIDGDGKLKATWEEGDVVYVYADASSTAYIGTLTPKSYGASTTTLTGDINAEGLSNGQTLYFSTKDRATFNLTSQDGTVESLFYFEATAPITIDGGNASVGDLSFARPITVVKFTLKDKGNSDAPISATSLTVSDGTNIYNVTPSSATAVLYVGISAISSATVTLYSTDGDQYYYYQMTGVTFTNNEYYAINVKMEASELARPLTFEAKADGFTVTLTSDMDPLPSLDYSIDGGAWTTYTCNAATPSVNTGHTISFRAKTTNVAFADNDSHISTFECNKDCYIYGNIMSLLSASGYATATSVGEMAFVQLFEDNENIYSHDTKELLLPATTLANYCYHAMFAGCTNLTTAPELPATTLADYCYGNMFYGCTNLTTASELPATTLANSCYASMFKDCTSLTTAPALPATTLVHRCYNFMFSGCTKLNSVTCLATDISAVECTNYWLNGVAATGTFTRAESMTGWTSGVNGIPSGWTTIPVIPGKFSVSSTKKVYFSQGNLQYTKSTSTWSFMEHQYSTVETNGYPYCSNDYGNKDVVSLFSWATSGYNHGATSYQPYSTNPNNENYYAYGDASYNLYDQTGRADWGYNAISNGGNTENSGWRTLTTAEWQYLFANHTTGWSTVNSVNGYVIRPDGVGTAIAASYTASDWATEEAAGSVFLPAAGFRNSNLGTYVYEKGSTGRYWSSSCQGSSNAYNLYFTSSSLGTNYSMNRNYGYSVRLVRDAE